MPSEARPQLPAEYRAVLDDLKAEMVSRRAEAFRANPQAAVWAAVTPFWTTDTAVKFPVDLSNCPYMVATGPGLFQMRPDDREAYLAGQLRGSEGPQVIRSVLAQVGDLLIGAKSVPPLLGLWARLATRASEPGASSRAFHEIIESLFKEKPAGALPQADVFNWIAAATPLAELLGRVGDPSLLQSIQRAGRRVELTDRELREKARLKRYLDRPDQDGVIRDFLRDRSSGVWALHFIGAGATGKTMLMRHLAWDLAQEADLNAVHARIDFDYLSPDYPRVAPGLLLWAFALELRAFAVTSTPLQHFGKADEFFDRVRAVATAPGGSPIDHPDFASALGEYGFALDLLSESGRRPVVLVLDTCEELTRHAADGGLQNVRDTFRILQSLRHGRLLPADGPPPTDAPARPYLRVVFSGRKLLASAGANYSGGDTALAPRPFLRLHEIRGFTETEARTYLTARHPVGAEYVDAILARSPDVGSVVRVTWAAGSGVTGDVPLHSPFELNDLAEWVTSAPRPEVEEVRTLDASRYVELRILRRISDPDVVRALPVAATAGHFDEQLVQAATGWPLDRVRQLVAGLDRQEWAHRRAGPGGAYTWSLEPVLRRRLANYFAARPGWEGDRRRAVEYLVEKTLRGPIDLLDWPTIDATFRLLADAPEPMTEWWGGLEGRLARSRGWVWLRDALRYVADAWAPRAGEAPEPYLPFVRGAYAAALQRTGAPADLRRAGEVWELVVEDAERFPLTAVAAGLRFRALALAVADRYYASRSWTDRLWDAIRGCDPATVDTGKAGSLVCALRAITEHVARHKGGDGPLTNPELRVLFGLPPDATPDPRADWEASGAAALLKLINQLPARSQGKKGSRERVTYLQLQAVNCLYQGRVQLLLGLGRGAAGIVEDAAGFARQIPDEPPDESIGDLFLPRDMKSLILAECLELLYPRYTPSRRAVALSERWTPAWASPEADRFSAALLGLTAAIGPRYVRQDAPRDFPGTFRAFVTASGLPRSRVVALESLGLFAPRWAIVQSLADRDPSAGAGNQAASPDDLPPHAVRAYARIALRFRLFDDGYRPLVAAHPTDTRDYPTIWLQCQQLAGYPLATTQNVRFDENDLLLRAEREPPWSPEEVAQWVRSADERSDHPVGRLLARIQSEALGAEVDPVALQQLADHIGLVAAAEHAMHAAEMMPNRRSEIAARLYRRAALWYREAEHFAGAFAATLNHCLTDPAADRRDLTDLYQSLTAQLADEDLPSREQLMSGRAWRLNNETEMPARVPPLWRPLLVRWMVLETRGTAWAGEVDEWVLRASGRRNGDEVVPPPDLRDWVPARPRPTARPGELVVQVPYADGSSSIEAVWRSADGEVYRASHRWDGTATAHSDLRVGLEAVLDRWAAASPAPELCLDVHPQAAGLNWERRVSGFAGGRPVRLRRVADGRLPSLPSPRKRPLVVDIETGGDSNHHGLAEQGWSAVHPSGGSLRVIGHVSGPSDAAPRPEVRVLHVIGAPIGGDGMGNRLRVSGRVARTPVRDVPLTDITLRYPGLALCVLQAPPIVEQDATTTEGTDDDARLFREFAHELFAAGAPAVLAVPPLPLDEATDAVARIARVLTSAEPDPVVRLGAAVRRLTEPGSVAPPGAFTPCLYLDREWSPE